MSRPPTAVRAVVPMKPLAGAKSRLWADVTTLEREAVILMLLDHVVRAAVEALGPGSCHVVGGDAVVRDVAKAAGAEWDEEQGTDLNSSVWLAMQAAYSEGCAAAIFLPGDLPVVSARDIMAVSAASESFTRPAAVRAKADGGTNALLVPASCAIEPQLGLQSFALHTHAAQRQGTPLAVVDAPGLAWDVDSPDDLEWARANVAGFRESLYHWHTLVELRARGQGEKDG